MLTPDEMALELSKLVYSKTEWLANFSEGRNKRPDFEISQRRRELECLTQARDSYIKLREKAA